MLKLSAVNLNKTKVDTLIIPVCEDARLFHAKDINQLVALAKKLEKFAGKPSEMVTVYDPPGLKVNRVVMFGIGPGEKVDPESFRAMSGRAVKHCIQFKRSRAMLAVPETSFQRCDNTSAVEAMLEGAYLANHLFDHYKKDKERQPLKEIAFLVTPAQQKRHRSLVKTVTAVCSATTLAREWVSLAPNDKRPVQFARAIVSQARREGLKTTVLDEVALKRQKFGAMLAVAEGSRNRPRLVLMHYRVPKVKKTIALVGKGVTFDSGGLNLKPSSGIADMKMDMSGAAAVAAAMLAIARLKPNVNVVGALPLVENMPSGNATRPGDIITSYSGKTVEIGNTDAEGRLILADAMAYVIKKYKPHTIIDMATLTGACVVALGEHIAAVFSKDDSLSKAIVRAGKIVFERCWPMPLPDDYGKQLESDFADINNMGKTRWGGAITAALFLSEFVGDTRWAHIDIAGPAYTKKEAPYCEPGGTGFGVRLLCKLLDELT
jgi:leucyl aminopeptidase